MALSALPFSYAAHNLGTELEFLFHGVRTEATVTSSNITRVWVYDSKRGNYLQTREYVTFQFRKLDGKLQNHRRATSSLAFPVGSKVTLRYLPDDPSSVELRKQDFGDRGFLSGLI
ncbi:MAG: DUF3592 domain-containing protein, partial [Paracoccaceae bacterium]